MLGSLLSYGYVGELDLADEHSAGLDEREPGVVEELVLILRLDIVIEVFSSQQTRVKKNGSKLQPLQKGKKTKMSRNEMEK
jgi:hypothetical protein